MGVGDLSVVMVLSAWRIQHWAGWEYYGDDADEDVSKLTAPMVIDNKVYDVLVNLVAQFIKTVDPYTYIAIRRYYIVREWRAPACTAAPARRSRF